MEQTLLYPTSGLTVDQWRAEQILRLRTIQTLRISSKGPASTHQSRRMGEYTRIEEERNGRPVWRSKGWFLTRYFYYTSGGHWMVGSDYTKDRGGIASEEAGLATIPEYGWEYVETEDRDWTYDPQLRVDIKALGLP